MKSTWFLLLLLAVVMMGCSVGRSGSGTYYNQNSGNTHDKMREISQEKRVVIYSASIHLKVKNADSTNALLETIAARYGGYAMTLGNKMSEIRVKAGELNNAIADISKLGRITDKTIYGNDVTDEYYDYQIRLENATKARQKYLELLEKAENVEAAVQVEKELERLNGEIDSLEGKLNRFNHLSAYSTITIDLRQRKKLGILGYVSVGLYEGVRWLFIRGR